MIPCDNVFLDLGDEYRDVSLAAEDHLDKETLAGLSEQSPLGVVLIWPKSLSWFSIETNGTNSADPAKLSAILNLAQVRQDQTSNYLGFYLPRSQPIRLTLVIRSSRPEFISWATHALSQSGPASTPTATVRVRIVTAIVEQKRVRQRELEFGLTPLREVEDYDGVVAIDLGNVNTTIACLPRTKTACTDIVVVDPRLQKYPTPTPVPTALRVISAVDNAAGNSVGPGQSQQRHAFQQPLAGNSSKAASVFPPLPGASPVVAALPTAAPSAADLLALADGMKFDCLFGEEASQNPQFQRNVVFGAKRMLMDQPGQSGFRLLMERGFLESNRRLLAELYLTEVLRGFAKRTRRFPRKVVITCPTTFAPKEHDNLRTAVQRALIRAKGKDSGVPVTASSNKNIDAIIDEATAASFYFIYRDFINCDGGVPGFTYQLANGGHALVIDCGGGTTDIALVRVKLGVGQHVTLEVVGRAGHRSFGGDYITKRLFALLKAKIFAADPKFAARVDLAPAVANNDWRPLMKQFGDSITQAIPTRFDPNIWQDADNDKRRDATRLLWSLAEEFKRTLSARVLPSESDEASPVKVEKNTEISYGDVLRYRQLDAVLLPNLARALGVAEATVQGLRVCREELDYLVEGEAKRTVDYANHLVRRLYEPDLGAEVSEIRTPPAIDRVYLVGNGSLYPLVSELFRDKKRGLAIPFLSLSDNDSAVATAVLQKIEDPDDMKAAVVKGAVLAQTLRQLGTNVDIQWNRDLINTIPFDIIHLGAGYPNGFRTLFKEGTRYDDCVNAELFQAPPMDGSTPTVLFITLHKQRPGDAASGDSPLGTATFRAPVSGKLRLDFKDKRFWLTSSSGEQVIVVPPPEPDPLGPVQSGEL